MPTGIGNIDWIIQRIGVAIEILRVRWPAATRGPSAALHRVERCNYQRAAPWHHRIRADKPRQQRVVHTGIAVQQAADVEALSVELSTNDEDGEGTGSVARVAQTRQ